MHMRAYLRLVLLGAVIGVPAAFMAAGFLALVHTIEHWLWHDLPDALGESAPPWYLVIGLPVAGAAIVLLARRTMPGDGGHSPLEGFAGGPTLLPHIPGVAIAAIGSLAFGAVLGPEAPLIALGSVAGLLVKKVVQLGAQGEKAIDVAGSFAAISALFGGPIVGGVLMVEASSGLGAAAIPALIPGFVAAAVGYVIFVGIGDWGGVASTQLAIPGLPVYDGTQVGDLALAVVIGILAALVVAGVRQVAGRIDSDAAPRLGLPVLLLGGGALVGILAQLSDMLGADSQDVLFSGQASIPGLLAQDSTRIVMILLVAKAVAYALCLGCGFRGGPVFPAMFIGVALATFPVIWWDVSPTVALAVGAAAGMAAMTRFVLTPILFGALLAGTAGIDAVPAAVLAAVAAWLTINALEQRPSRRSAVEAVTANVREH